MSLLAVAVVAFDQISPFHLSVPCLVFGDTHPHFPKFNFAVCATESGAMSTTGGFSLYIAHDLSILKTADIIIIPSWRNIDETAPQALLDALNNAHQRGAQLVGLCLGAFVLAQAGLLNGRSATTHWAYAEQLKARYPQVNVDADVLYIEEGNVLTSAGTAAAVDCCLHIIRSRYGSDIANQLARRLVVPPHRQGGQAQYIEQPIPTTIASTRLSEAMDFVRANLDKPHSLDSLANKLAMSRRTLTRQFKQLTGTTVGEWLLQERLAYAQRLLEMSEHDIDNVATLAGFGSTESLRLHFKRAFSVSPQAWRQTFKG